MDDEEFGIVQGLHLIGCRGKPMGLCAFGNQGNDVDGVAAHCLRKFLHRIETDNHCEFFIRFFFGGRTAAS